MNTAKLALALSTILAACAVACSSETADNTGSTEQHATADIDHMFKRPDGSFDVWCADGSQQVATAADIKNDNVCGAASGSSSGNSSGGAPAACIAPDVPAPIQWLAPAAPSTVCQPADLQKLSDVAQTATSWKDIIDAVTAQNAACGACIFTDVAGPNWGPIITFQGGEQGAFVNWSNCYAQAAAGGSAACGEAEFEQGECVAEMCQSCGDNASSQSCAQDALDASKCGQYDVETACNGAATVNSACQDLFTMIGYACGGK